MSGFNEEFLGPLSGLWKLPALCLHDADIEDEVLMQKHGTHLKSGSDQFILEPNRSSCDVVTQI